MHEAAKTKLKHAPTKLKRVITLTKPQQAGYLANGTVPECPPGYFQVDPTLLALLYLLYFTCLTLLALLYLLSAPRRRVTLP